MPPIKPEDVLPAKARMIPDDVFNVVNDKITYYFTNNRATIFHDEIVGALIKLGYSRTELYVKGWLDFADAYRAVGWHVEYVHPEYKEAHRSYYVLTLQ